MKNYTQEEKKAYAKERQTELNASIKEINDGVEKVFQSENWKNYLNFSSSFHKYSVNNTIWLWLQNPNASQVASFLDWKKKERNIKKGEKGLKVYVPIPKKFSVKNENGEEEQQIRMLFKVGYVFDISQTEGKDIPTICNATINDDRVTQELIEKLIPKLESTTNFKIKYLDNCDDGAFGWCNVLTCEIAILKEQSPLEKLSTLIHECSHALNRNKNLKRKTTLEKCDEEIIAESVAYCTLKYFDLDTSSYSFEYIANWYSNKNQNGKLLREVLDEIHTNANILIDAIDSINIKF